MAERAAQMGDREFGEQIVEHGLALFAIGLDHLEHGADVVLDRQAAEDRRLLRQIADAQARAPVHGQVGDVLAVEDDDAVLGPDQAGDDVEAGRLAGAVRAQQANRLAALNGNADAAQHRPLLEALAEAVGDETGVVGDQARSLDFAVFAVRGLAGFFGRAGIGHQFCALAVNHMAAGYLSGRPLGSPGIMAPPSVPSSELRGTKTPRTGRPGTPPSDWPKAG